jgi:Flp pilus assembly protein TadG
MKKILRLPTSSRGQSLVELAISILILIYLLSGAVEFGIAFFQFVQLRDAAQEGALYGAITPPASAGDTAQINAIIDRAKASSASPIDLQNNPDISVSVTVTGGYCEGGALKVQITYPHRVFMPFMSTFTGPTIPLNASVTDTILRPICSP